MPATFTTAPKAAIGYVGLDFGASVIESVTQVRKSGFAGGSSETGLGKSMFVRPADSAPGNLDPAKFAAAVKAVESAQKAIEDGSVKVPFITTMP